MTTRIRATAVLGLPAVMACCSLPSATAAAASTVSPLPASDYTVRHVCAAPAPGYAGCLALRLVPQTAAARAHTHPLGMTRSAPIVAAEAAEGVFGLRPQDLHSAYFSGEVPDAPASEPQTIALVDAYDDPNAEADLKVYDKEFALGELPKCTTGEVSNCFEKVNQNGKAAPLPSAEGEEAEGWALESATDIEVAHAVCRNCRIMLVEANSAEYTDLEAAENTAVTLGATEVSNSWGGGEPPFDSGAFQHSGTVITAAAGDNGYLNWTEAEEAKSGYFAGADYPASSPHVVAVGGTKLTLSGGARQSETVWNDGEEASGAAGGGCSERFTAQPWQREVPDWASVSCDVGGASKRAVADVSADADPLTGVAVYDSVPYPEEGGSTTVLDWVSIGGTSVASPIIASMFALAGGAHKVEYPAQTLYSHLGSKLLYDVTEGGNGRCDGVYLTCSGSMSPLSALDCGQGTLICNAAPGYDGPTGVGTPNGIAAFEPGGEGKQQTEEKRRAEEKLREEEQRSEQEREERQRKEREAEEEKNKQGGNSAGNGSTSGTSGGGTSGAGASASTGASQAGGAGPSKGASSATASGNATIELSAFALTPRALLALHGTRPKASQLAFAFTMNIAARIRVKLAKLIITRGHKRWQTLPYSLTIAGARGRDSARLSAHHALAPGRYRLTLTPVRGVARTLTFTAG
jgi:hypothetical protein